MNKIAKISAISLIAATTGLAAIGATASWGEREGYGPGGEYCERGEYGMKGSHHKSMKKQRFEQRELDLSAEQARTLVSARLIMQGNDRLKVGEVKAKDDDSYVVDITTVEGSLVRQVEVDREKGLPRGHMAHR